jgi:hypothetical protein
MSVFHWYAVRYGGVNLPAIGAAQLLAAAAAAPAPAPVWERGGAARGRLTARVGVCTCVTTCAIRQATGRKLHPTQPPLGSVGSWVELEVVQGVQVGHRANWFGSGRARPAPAPAHLPPPRPVQAAGAWQVRRRVCLADRPWPRCKYRPWQCVLHPVPEARSQKEEGPRGAAQGLGGGGSDVPGCTYLPLSSFGSAFELLVPRAEKW